MRKLGVVAFVALGVFSLVHSIGYVSAPISLYAMGSDDARVFLTAVFTLFPFVGYVGLGLFLIVRRKWLANRLIEDTPLDLPLDATSLMRLAVLFMGVGLMVEAVPSMIDVVVQPMILAASDQSILGQVAAPRTEPLSTLAGLIGPVLRFALGAVLVTRSKPLSSWLWLGHRDESDAEPEPIPSSDQSVSRCAVCGTPYDPADYEGGLAAPLCVECKAPLELHHA